MLSQDVIVGSSLAQPLTNMLRTLRKSMSLFQTRGDMIEFALDRNALPCDSARDALMGVRRQVISSTP